MKKYVIGLITGLLISGIVVYAANYTAAQINYTEDKTVESALNELYNNSNKTGKLTVFDQYQLNVCDSCTYEIEDSSVISISETGLVKALKKGTTNVKVMSDGFKVLTLNIKAVPELFTITSGKYYSNNTPYIDNNASKNIEVKKYLTDGSTSKLGSYGSLWLSSSYSYIKFTLTDDVVISFSSNYYSDSGGSSGKKAKFYKINDDGTETLSYTLTQENNSEKYGAHKFEKGNYALRVESNYVVFDEFHFEAAN